jgi:hypothetical protein
MKEKHPTFPVYAAAEKGKNPVEDLAWLMSELHNDNAPIGWRGYIPLAAALMERFEMKERKR